MYRAEFEQNKAIRAEFRAELAIFTSTASRQNKLCYEQNLSKPNEQGQNAEILVDNFAVA